MSLQSRLATLITAIGTDIKEHDARMDGLLSVPQLFMRGGITHPPAAGNSIFWITSEQDVAIQPNTDTNRMPITRDITPSKYDVVPGFKPQVRLRSVIGTNSIDPGTQTFTCALTSIITIPGAGAAAGGNLNRRFNVAGGLIANQRTNLAAATAYTDESAWTDLTAAALSSAGMTAPRAGVYLHATATTAANGMISCEWEIELRYVPV